MPQEISEELTAAALAYHRNPRPGKLEINPTKPLANQRDLALAYSPGVAAACQAISADPAQAAELTARGNLVAVVTNGTAVLGLGDIGPLAAKPVMEGKAVLFKKFAGIDVFDIEIAEKDPARVVDIVAALEPTFGGINLEDIKAPECFEIEESLGERMGIPVFHDDQHGTAIIVAAAVLNALHLTGKRLDGVKLVTSGAGAAALACLSLLVQLGLKRENIWVTDIEGVVFKGRPALMDRWKAEFAQATDARTLADALAGADVFLGLSAGGVLRPEYLELLAKNPLILALANPHPEVMPEVVERLRPDALMCTGRSDYPNQVNNVLCFPYIFRGALDVSASRINDAMKIAAVRAIAELAREAPSDEVIRANGGAVHPFGERSLIPAPFDPRLILKIAPAVAQAAIDSGVARKALPDMEAYVESLSRFAFRTRILMKPLLSRAKNDPRRVVFAEGEDERVLRAVQVIVEERIAKPILVGRPAVIDARIKRHGLSARLGVDFELINPEDDPRYRDYVATLVEIAGRSGVTPDIARTLVRTDTTVIAALAVVRNDADAMLCGVEGHFDSRLDHIRRIIGPAERVRRLSALSLIITAKGGYFLADTHVQQDPSAEEIAEIATASAEHVRRFGILPKVALLSHSNFGASESASAQKMRRAFRLVRAAAPDLEVDGEMHADTALSAVIRERYLPSSRLHDAANLLIMPNLDAASIALDLTKVLSDGLLVGPILVGAARPAHILTPSVTARGILNMTAIAVVEAQTLAAMQAPQQSLPNSG
jgi:malate dehydrogenase (oxaloacetate-decarboxylating)(NADP+)